MWNVAKAQRCGLDKAERFEADVSVGFEWNPFILINITPRTVFSVHLLLRVLTDEISLTSAALIPQTPVLGENIATVSTIVLT